MNNSVATVSIISNTMTTIASLIDTIPLAIGRYILTGCSLSFSRSTISLIIYTTEDTQQKETKPNNNSIRFEFTFKNNPEKK